jgi:predicted trehalose synthase
MRNLKHAQASRTLMRAGILAGAAGLAALAACGPFRRTATSTQPPALLYFTNESLDQADVFAVTSSNQRTRIGTVFAGRTDTLTVPREIAARGDNVNIVVRLLARSATPASGPVPIRPGDHLVVRLPSDQKLLVVLPGNQ